MASQGIFSTGNLGEVLLAKPTSFKISLTSPGIYSGLSEFKSVLKSNSNQKDAKPCHVNTLCLI